LRFTLFLVAATLYIPALLIADSPGLIPQLALGLATLLFLALFARRSEVDTRQIACAILVATTGEIILSIGWGLYTYHNALIPLYVTFGHGIFSAGRRERPPAGAAATRAHDHARGADRRQRHRRG
jgi:hypothetical protein